MSSVVDEDTARAIDSGRATVGAVLKGAQEDLKRVFLAFLFAFLGAVLAMRLYVWDYLEGVTKSRLNQEVAAELDLIARTPFDVILMQIKIGLILGAIAGIVAGAYYARKAILDRMDSSIPITRSRIYGFIALSVLLAVAGILYAYLLFFPLMFKVLAEQAFQAGVKPSYGIVRFTEFLLLLTISFGLAAQLPLFMGALAYTEIVPYETFRDKWRYAVLGIFVFGAVFSPPDPFTQIMWAVPLITLYAFSLGLAKVVTNVRRAGAAGSPVEPGTFRRKGYQIVGAAAIVGVGTVVALWAGAAEVLGDAVLPHLPERVELPFLNDLVLPTSVEAGEPADWVRTGAIAGLLAGAVALVAHLIGILRSPVVPRAGAGADPADVDLRALDAEGVRAAPPEVFEELTEDEAVEIASEAIEEEDREKAQLVLDRFDAVNAESEEEDEEDAAGEDGDASAAGASAAGTGSEGEDEDVVTSTATGMVDAFTAEETTEDDIGGYLYDIQFVLDSVRSRMFHVFALFVGAFTATFGYLYWRGIEDIMRQFTARVPDERFRPGAGASESTDIVIALHPVEVLIFIVKFSGIVAILVTLPVVLYYAWPAIQERGFASGGGDRRGFLAWGAVFLAGTLGGAVLGFTVIAPYVISWLVDDAIASGMVISYRIRSLLWVVFFMTIGIGLFVNVPIGMLLMHYSGLIGFDAMHRRWRHVTFGIFVVAGFFTPGGVLTMIVLAVPAALSYLLGVGILWVLTLPTRLRREPSEPQAS